MPRYSIVPLDQSAASIDMVAPDAASVLQLIGRGEFTEADVLCDKKYAFTVHLNDKGFWTLFQRDGCGNFRPLELI
jgi:hypothetical protein